MHKKIIDMNLIQLDQAILQITTITIIVIWVMVEVDFLPLMLTIISEERVDSEVEMKRMINNRINSKFPEEHL